MIIVIKVMSTAPARMPGIDIGIQAPGLIAVSAPFATTVWDYINRGMPLGREGSLKPDEVYALTAFLLNLNEVIPEEFVLDQQSLPKVKMRSEEHTSELQSLRHLVCRLLLEKKKKRQTTL